MGIPWGQLLVLSRQLQPGVRISSQSPCSKASGRNGWHSQQHAIAWNISRGPSAQKSSRPACDSSRQRRSAIPPSLGSAKMWSPVTAAACCFAASAAALRPRGGGVDPYNLRASTAWTSTCPKIPLPKPGRGPFPHFVHGQGKNASPVALQPAGAMSNPQ